MTKSKGIYLYFIWHLLSGNLFWRLFQNLPNKLNISDSDYGFNPYPVSGGTVLFAHGPSVESWPWWTGQAGPAELQEGKPGEENWEGSKCKWEIIEWWQQNVSYSGEHCIALHNSCQQKLDETCVYWRGENSWFELVGIELRERVTRTAWHHKHKLQQAD